MPSDGGAAGGVLAATHDRGDLAIGHPHEVVIGDGLALLEGQRAQRVPESGAVAPADVVGAGSVRQLGHGDGASLRRANLVDGLAMGDGHQPGHDVTVGAQAGICLHRRQERLGPGVLGVIGTQHRAAHAQDGRAVVRARPARRVGGSYPENVPATPDREVPCAGQSRCATGASDVRSAASEARFPAASRVRRYSPVRRECPRGRAISAGDGILRPDLVLGVLRWIRSCTP